MKWLQRFELPRRLSVACVAILSICLAAVAFSAQTLRKGVSVELAPTRSAEAMPAADNTDAIIVAVTRSGSVFDGINPVAPDELAAKLKEQLSVGVEKNVYIKADARTPYSNVVKVLDAVRTAGIERSALLTAQHELPKSGTLVPPKGLEVLLRSPSSGSGQIEVHVLESEQGLPTLLINKDKVPWDQLQLKLAQSLRARGEKTIVVEADKKLLFAAVAHVIDISRSTGATVIIDTPGL